MKAFVIQAICLNCGEPTEGRWICDACVSKSVNSMTPEDMLFAAKLGMIALVDEATGYQRIRAKDELYALYMKYLT